MVDSPDCLAIFLSISVFHFLLFLFPTFSWHDFVCNSEVSLGASYWSRSLESDATVRADYALTTTTFSCWLRAVDLR